MYTYERAAELNVFATFVQCYGNYDLCLAKLFLEEKQIGSLAGEIRKLMISSNVRCFTFMPKPGRS